MRVWGLLESISHRFGECSMRTWSMRCLRRWDACAVSCFSIRDGRFLRVLTACCGATTPTPHAGGRSGSVKIREYLCMRFARMSGCHELIFVMLCIWSSTSSQWECTCEERRDLCDVEAFSIGRANSRGPVEDELMVLHPYPHSCFRKVSCSLRLSRDRSHRRRAGVRRTAGGCSVDFTSQRWVGFMKQLLHIQSVL